MRRNSRASKISLTFIGLFVAIILFFQNCSNKHEAFFLEAQLSELHGYMDHRDILNDEVSKSDVAWHIDHSLKVINRLYDTLQLSNPDDYAWNLNFTRMAVWVSGAIPRGRAQAATSVVPPENIKTEDIISQMDEAKSKLNSAMQLDENSNFNHPVFGMLDRDGTLRFIEIHTNHHLKIIRDILEE